MKLKIYYCVTNGGDGSAYPSFFESKELAEWDEEHEEEGWAESSVGGISFESESPIVCLDEIITKESYFIDEYLDEYGDNDNENEKEEFLEKFFPNGLPTFSVGIEPANKTEDYVYNNVYVDDKKVARVFRKKENSGEVFAELLNNVLKDGTS